jgi:post-segregation antitoxin (ccd killing protein)
MTKRKNAKTVFRVRTDTNHVGDWSKIAKKRGQNTSAFARAAMDASAVRLVDESQWQEHLRDMRSSLNAALSVRTLEQSHQRVKEVVGDINRLIRKEIDDACF